MSSTAEDEPKGRTVEVGGVTFKLSARQIAKDAPSIFSQSPSSHPLVLDRSPELFKLIRDHLSGYRIFPLNPYYFATALETTYSNLLDDALAYGLRSLAKTIIYQMREIQARPNEVQKQLAVELGLFTLRESAFL
ncbi:hypothetical protein BCR35DRAFT_306349 [Leucosporidium creatinivorum]|uniref:BTB domain-containing protein n=1 Tax=Leucosporidium creatinivorum TaxID=106004 RepID=A0A1Y2EVS7_9BASI|nr:hypothetical protein BCR35DRAFT_306349 [Leucosporidium creatinivorum]